MTSSVAWWKDRKSLLGELVGRGFFANVLPPVFSSSSLANWAATQKPNQLPKFAQGKSWTESVSFDRPKSDGGTRRFEIPNPCSFLAVAGLISQQSRVLKEHFSNARITPLALPQPTELGGLKPAFQARRELRASVHAGYRFLLRADIASCFERVYTHSIPWAVLGKGRAKEFRKEDKNHWSNQLDQALQASRNGQTNGISVGPETSRFAVELVLRGVDEVFADALEANDLPIAGYRLVDDYELGFNEEWEAERAIGLLQGALADFGLGLNSRKTTISRLPIASEDPWVGRLRRLGSELCDPFSAADVLQWRDSVIQAKQENPSASVFTFAAEQVRHKQPNGDAAYLAAKDALLGFAMLERTALQTVMTGLHAWSKKYGSLGDDQATVRTVRSSLQRGFSTRALYDIAWSLWSAIVLSVDLTTSATDAEVRDLISTRNDIVGLLALDMHQGGLLNLDVEQLAGSVDPDPRGPNWLMVYQWRAQEQLRELMGTPPRTSGVGVFDPMIAAGISFYRGVHPVPDTETRVSYY